ncbi:Uncharacterised protein family (UPF0193) [Nesidiocoris tenuis]|uniref:Uncharacterized protein n=1 Tax=Nesidiocoris tenuis TaxID=355587 RepID=A0ABN7B5K7_9HEMI|nr:Uncharacterised protein family (UPF0193) [Nesidiocoris tenuis]
MDRKNSGVARGGLFHTMKVEYDPDTHRFLKELIKESKLSIFHRRMINDSIKNGDPLPLPKPNLAEPKPRSANDARKKMASIPIRRKKEQIERSGAYDRDTFTIHSRAVDYDEEKRRLQELMAFGKTLKGNKAMRLSAPGRRSSYNTLDSREKTENDVKKILDEINNREQFLAEMKALGRGKPYESMIRQEIAAKIRHLEKMDDELRTSLRKEYAQIQEAKAAVKATFQH